MTLRSRPLALLALLAAQAAAAAPRAPPPAPLDARVELVQGRLRVSADLAAAFPDSLERQLGNGLTNLVATHVAVVPARGGGAAAIFPREIEVLYDVWEEVYLVTVRDPATPRGKSLTFSEWSKLRAFLSRLDRIPLGPASALEEADAWSVQVRVELNPISQELLERTRELISDPAAGSRSGPSRSVLGAMASYLLRAEPGTNVRIFRSPPFAPEEVPQR